MPIRVGVQIQPQQADFAAMRRAWRDAEELGVDSIYTWDHFFPLYGDPEGNHFEGVVSLSALAASTERVSSITRTTAACGQTRRKLFSTRTFSTANWQPANAPPMASTFFPAPWRIDLNNFSSAASFKSNVFPAPASPLASTVPSGVKSAQVVLVPPPSIPRMPIMFLELIIKKLSPSILRSVAAKGELNFTGKA